MGIFDMLKKGRIEKDGKPAKTEQATEKKENKKGVFSIIFYINVVFDNRTI